MTSLAGAPVGPPVPYSEVPIYLQDAHRGDHHYYDESDTTAEERHPISGRECWIDIDLIPAVPPLAPTSTVTPATAVLTAVSGNPYRFGNVAFVDMIPANYGGGAYEPTLVDSAGKTVPYNPSVWVADGIRSVVEFKYQTPAQLGYAPPFTLSYWQYTGAFAGAGGGPTPPVPTNVHLYVDDTGSDTSGDGSLANPFATLQRAFADINASGWDNTAVVTIKNQLTVPSTAVTALNAGGRGRQTAPVNIQGLGQTIIRSGAVAASTSDTTSGIWRIAPVSPFTSADVGRILRFTSGAYSAYVPGAGDFYTLPPPAPFELEVYVAQVNNDGSATISFAETSLIPPTPGTTFDVLDNTSTLVLGGEVGALALCVFESQTPLIFRNFDVQLTGPAHTVGGLGVAGFSAEFIGVRFYPGDTNEFLLTLLAGGLINTASYQVNQSISPIVPSVLGLAFVDPAGAASFTLISTAGAEPMQLVNSAFASAALQVGGAASLLQCAGTGEFGFGPADAEGDTTACYFDGGAGLGNNVTITADGGVASAVRVHILNSASAGLAASNGGRLTTGDVETTGCVVGLSVVSGGAIFAQGGTTLTGVAPTSTNAVVVGSGGMVHVFSVSSFTVSGPFTSEVVLVEGGTLLLGGSGTLALSNAGSGVLAVQGGVVSFPSVTLQVTTADPSSAAVALDGGATVDGSDILVSPGSTGGVSVQGGSSLVLAGALTASGLTGTLSTSAGLYMTGGARVVAGAVTCTANAGSGVLAQTFASVSPASILDAFSITADSNSVFGVRLDYATVLVGAGGISAPDNTNTNLGLTDTTLVCEGSITATGVSSPGASNVYLKDSDCVVNGRPPSIDGSGNGNVGGGTAAGISVANSTLRAEGLKAVGCVYAGISADEGSFISVVSDFEVNDCGTGLIVAGGSTVTATGNIAASQVTTSGAGAGVAVTNGTLLLGYIGGGGSGTGHLVANNAGPGHAGLTVSAGSYVRVGTVSALAGDPGVLVDGSELVLVGGDLDVPGSTTGFLAQNGSKVTLSGSLIADTCTSQGFSVTSGSTLTVVAEISAEDSGPSASAVLGASTVSCGGGFSVQHGQVAPPPGPNPGPGLVVQQSTVSVGGNAYFDYASDYGLSLDRGSLTVGLSVSAQSCNYGGGPLGLSPISLVNASTLTVGTDVTASSAVSASDPFPGVIDCEASALTAGGTITAATGNLPGITAASSRVAAGGNINLQGAGNLAEISCAVFQQSDVACTGFLASFAGTPAGPSLYVPAGLSMYGSRLTTGSLSITACTGLSIYMSSSDLICQAFGTPASLIDGSGGDAVGGYGAVLTDGSHLVANALTVQNVAFAGIWLNGGSSAILGETVGGFTGTACTIQNVSDGTGLSMTGGSTATADGLTVTNCPTPIDVEGGSDLILSSANGPTALTGGSGAAITINAASRLSTPTGGPGMFISNCSGGIAVIGSSSAFVNNVTLSNLSGVAIFADASNVTASDLFITGTGGVTAQDGATLNLATATINSSSGSAVSGTSGAKITMTNVSGSANGAYGLALASGSSAAVGAGGGGGANIVTGAVVGQDVVVGSNTPQPWSAFATGALTTVVTDFGQVASEVCSCIPF
jgi:hypothetical protein